MKKEINIVWFKRDFRLTDHLPLSKALGDHVPVVLISLLEPSLMASPQSDTRHWRFVIQSVKDINSRLKRASIQLLVGEALEVFEMIGEHFVISKVFSHQETGIKLTYQRDIALANYFATQGISWEEYPYAGVIRGISKRNNWPKHWYGIMSEPTVDPDLAALEEPPGLNLRDYLPDSLFAIPHSLNVADNSFQKGGETFALKYLQSFFHSRVNDYNKHISKPLLSRKSCSRLSPYLAWGNLSMRQVYHAAQHAKQNGGNKRNINAFMSRLRWHCHFIQKFEMMERYEDVNINPQYDSIRTSWDEQKYKAWEQGMTGYPLVDACMRCVTRTGYLNFRMRSMVVSFLTHHLWLHWKKGADFLARQFLDFEPGIHYPQFQMQAGTTGYNTIRIYNPIKQSKENDPEGEFIKSWVPELQSVPTNHIHEPWKMPLFEQQLYNCVIGEGYPSPIVEVSQTYKHASSQLWSKKGEAATRKEARKILAKQNEEDRVSQ